MLVALASVLVKTLRRSGMMQSAHPERARSSIDDIPVLQPVRDAEPHADEPLKESDLRVAQNAPF
jgi:hypothetical protein